MVYILLGKGFEELEAIAVGDVLRRGGVEVCYTGVGSLLVHGSHDIAVMADTIVGNMDFSKAEMLVIPGGMGGVETIESSELAMKDIQEAHRLGIEVAAICAGPRVLAKLGILQGRDFTCYPGMEGEMTGGQAQPGAKVVRTPGVTTGMGPGTAVDFGLALLEVLRGKAVADQVAAAMCHVR